MSEVKTHLRKMKKCGDVEGLIRMLGIGSSIERRDAICTLGKLRSKKAVIPLIELLASDEVLIRSNAAWALGKIADMRATRPLLGILNDPSENVRIHAVWSLGRLGDRRAIRGLRSVLSNCSSDLEKYAKEAMARIELNKDDYDNSADMVLSSESAIIPLITVDVPSDLFECDYGSREVPKNGNGSAMKLSKDVVIEDTKVTDRFLGENLRRIMLGLKKEFTGLASIDILFSYMDNNNGGQKSSVWLQMATDGKGYFMSDPQNIYKTDSISDRGLNFEGQMGKTKRTTSPHSIKNSRITSSRRYVHKSVNCEYSEPEEQKNDLRKDDLPSLIDITTEDYSEQKSGKEKETESRMNHFDKRRSVVQEAEIENKKDTHIIESDESTPRNDNVGSKIQTIKTPQNVPQAESKPHAAKATEEIKAAITSKKTEIDVDSAVKFLTDIGMSGVTNAASTVTQLSGQEDSSLKSQLRILPIDQVHNEIVNLGESIALVEIGLHGKGPEGKINGRMHFYLSKNAALEVANQLLCIPPEAAIKEFTEDIISTLKETSNIFGGQYISAISEYIEIPLVLEAPVFKTGGSMQIVESEMKGVSEKVEFALATDLAFGKNKTGRLIILLDPRSFDIIIKKLF